LRANLKTPLYPIFITMRPFVFVNLAMSADGKISTRERRQVRISGQADFTRVDRLKASCDAIMVGIGTVLADDPSLTVKSAELKAERIARGKDENPVRVVVDSHARTPPDADILRKGPGKRVVAVSGAAPSDRVDVLKQYAEVIVAGEDRVDIGLLLETLGSMGVGRLMVEGGGTLIWAFFSAGCVDEFYTYIGNLVIGGKDAPTPADGEGFIREPDFPALRLMDSEVTDQGLLVRWQVVR
jgi:2,5-diamino-6-(ribosylamino)-4(3H)-pyrimidinone 5'-phosphate reductase